MYECRECEHEYETQEGNFYRRTGGGYSRVCITCTRKRRKEIYRDNPDHGNNMSKSYYHKNKETRREHYRKVYRSLSPEERKIVNHIQYKRKQQRMRDDPEYAAKIRKQKREQYLRRKERK